MSTTIKKARIKTGLTQEEAAVKIGIHPTTLNKYEGGSRTPSGKVLSSIAQLFGVSMDSLLNENPGGAYPSVNLDKEEEMEKLKDKLILSMERERILQNKVMELQEEIYKLGKPKAPGRKAL